MSVQACVCLLLQYLLQSCSRGAAIPAIQKHDPTLICEITANASQDGPVQQIVREALADQLAEDRVAGGGSVIEPVGQVVAPTGKCMELELTRKRKAEDFELQAKKDCKKVYNKAWYASNKDHKNDYAKA